METYQEKAWDCLTEKEQNSLFLNISQGKSTWEVSEMLKTSHYKYLEIKARSEKFFRLFSDYFYLYGDLFTPESTRITDQYFRDYLRGAMLKRLPKEEASVYAGDSSWLLYPVKNDQIRRNVLRLRESKDKSCRDLYALIMEFDRWNNYRILPLDLQAPSPYKRRMNKKYKAYMRYLHTLPNSKIKNLVGYFWTRDAKKNRYYTCFISTQYREGYQVVPIPSEKSKKLEELTKLKMYVFEDRVSAEEFGLLVSTYFTEVNTQKRGLKFWKEFDELVTNAVNYKEINNIDFSINTLDTAYQLKRKPIRELGKRASDKIKK